MGSPGYLAGKLLLAMPGMGDPRFQRSAIAMCVHDRTGALGIDLGRPSQDMTLIEVFEQFGIAAQCPAEADVFEGGPVEQRRGFVLHSCDYESDATLTIEGRFALTASHAVLEEIAAGRGPRRWRFALGYSGWGAGQLDEELTRHGWMVADMDADLIFDLPPEQLWSAAYQAIGIDPALLTGQMGHG